MFRSKTASPRPAKLPDVTRSFLVVVLLLACASEHERLASTEPPDVEYARDVEPILRAQCTGCHREGGSAPFALDRYARVAPHAQQIALVTRSGRMPPWPPASSDDCPQLIGARGLKEREIALLEAWAAAGAPEGESVDAAADGGERTRDRREHGEQAVAELQHVDAVLQASEPYLPRPRVDDHRCFPLDPQLPADRYLTAYAVREEVPGIVHHVQLWAFDDAAAEAELDALDAAEPGPGYACPEGVTFDARYVSVWAPSDPLRRHPEGTGVLLRGGRRVVVQIHYNDRLALGLPDRTAIELELEESVPLPARMWTVSNGDIVLPPGEPRRTVRALSGIPASAPVQLWGVRPHMHALGSSARIDVLTGDSVQCLLDVPRWDPAWQLMYFYPQAITLGPADTLEVECNYDTRGQTETVRYGIRTSDEMCFGFFYVTGGE